MSRELMWDGQDGSEREDEEFGPYLDEATELLQFLVALLSSTDQSNDGTRQKGWTK